MKDNPPPTSVTKAAVISVHTDVLEAVAKWAGTDEGRPHLHQVFFSKGAMVAVDGHRLVIVPCETFGMTFGVNRQYLLAAVAAHRLLEAGREIAITREDSSLVRLALAPGVSIHVPAADHDKFPPYAQVVRDSENAGRSSSPAGYGFRPSYLAAIHEVDVATSIASEVHEANRGVKVVAWSDDNLGAMVFENMAGVKFLVMPIREPELQRS